MRFKLQNQTAKIFRNALLLSLFFGILTKVILIYFDVKFIELTSIHGAVLSGCIFVASVLLSAAVNDFKECERLVCDFAANIESIHQDISTMSSKYKIDKKTINNHLVEIIDQMDEELVNTSRNTVEAIHTLSIDFSKLDDIGVPPNFVTKLKSEQSSMLRTLTRMNYIQSIKFLPSSVLMLTVATIGTISLMVLTDFGNIELSIIATWLITLILIFINLLIRKIGQPFELKGLSKDDVSLAPLKLAYNHISSNHKD